jgi:hypothetical protein
MLPDDSDTWGDTEEEDLTVKMKYPDNGICYTCMF